MNSPKVSIIVPVYNSSAYLTDCLDSILQQNYLDYELLLVDDGSADSSGAICDEYARKDSRIRVFHKINGGVSSARNLGIENSLGEWLYFVDSDDLLMNGCLKTLVERIDENVDCVAAGYAIVNECGINENQDGQTIQNKIIKPDIFLLDVFQNVGPRYQGYLWCKLFSKRIVSRFNISFNSSIFFNEDRFFIVEYLCHCEGGVSFTSRPVYQYFERSSSAMGSLEKRYNPKLVTDLEAMAGMFQVVKKFLPGNLLLLNAVKNACFASYWWNYGLMVRHDSFDKFSHKRLNEALLSVGLASLINKTSKKILLKTFVAVFFPKLYIKLDRCRNGKKI